MEIGKHHTLKVDRITPPGAYLTNGSEDVLLPTKYFNRNTKVGQEIKVFVYKDSEGRKISTTLKPHAEVNQFAFLKVNDVNDIGAFLEWGIEKDILVPYREQKLKLRKGQWCLVFLYLDEKSERVAATAKVAKYFKPAEGLAKGDEVALLITNDTELGTNVVVNNQFKGLIYATDIFHDFLEGDRIKGYVKEVRADGKLDISLRKEGMENLEVGAQQILEELKNNDGFLPLHDKSSPEEIQMMLQMSKKNFKRSVGILYKQKRIAINQDGIHLLSN